jgi:hypothetical protein
VRIIRFRIAARREVKRLAAIAAERSARAESVVRAAPSFVPLTGRKAEAMGSWLVATGCLNFW